MKKTKYQQVSEILERDGHIGDQQLYEIWGDESFCHKAVECIRRYQKYKQQRDFYKNKVIVEKCKGHRKHLIRLQGVSHWHAVGKEFYESVTI